jgi:hypothetical protein
MGVQLVGDARRLEISIALHWSKSKVYFGFRPCEIDKTLVESNLVNDSRRGISGIRGILYLPRSFDAGQAGRPVGSSRDFESSRKEVRLNDVETSRWGC